MGWASFNEDNESRYHNATIIRKREHDAMTTPEQRNAGPSAAKLKAFAAPTARPLPVLVLADASGSMSQEGKIDALNVALREMISSFANCHDPCGSPWMMEDTGGVRASAGRGRSIL